MAFQATLCWAHAVGHNHSAGLSAYHADMDCAQVCRDLSSQCCVHLVQVHDRSRHTTWLLTAGEVVAEVR